MEPGRSDQEYYNELAGYTLSLGDPSFIHQHVVDAFAAQHADERSKPVYLAFALIGLYLYIEKGYTGREVQAAHMRLARRHKGWPALDLPEKRGEISVSDVLDAPPGRERDRMIRRWCESVWKAYRDSHEKVAALVQSWLWDR